MLQQVVNGGGCMHVKQPGCLLCVEYALLGLHAKSVFTVAANVEDRETASHATWPACVRTCFGVNRGPAACGDNRGNCSSSLQHVSALHGSWLLSKRLAGVRRMLR